MKESIVKHGIFSVSLKCLLHKALFENTFSWAVMRRETSDGCLLSLHLSVFILRILFKDEFLFLQSNFWRCSQLPLTWLWYERDMRRLFSTLQEHHLHWDVFTDVQSAGTLATVKSPGFTFQVTCYFYRTIAAHRPYSFLSQAACCFTLPGDFAGFVSEQIGPGYMNLRGKLPMNKWVSQWWSSNTGGLHVSLSQIVAPLFVKPYDYRCF